MHCCDGIVMYYHLHHQGQAPTDYWWSSNINFKNEKGITFAKESPG